MLEKTRVIQQCIEAPNSNLHNLEPISTELNKCPSTSNIFNFDQTPKNYPITKSQSGGHLQNTNGNVKNGSSSSASGISSPSNNSGKDDDEK